MTKTEEQKENKDNNNGRGRPPNCSSCGRPKTQCKCGRPTKMTKDTVNKLEQAFALGCTDEEACAYADISRTTLFNYQKENPQFLNKKKQLKVKPVLKARKTIVENLSSVSNARWFIKRKRRQEFGDSVDVTTKGDKVEGINITFVEPDEDPDIQEEPEKKPEEKEKPSETENKQSEEGVKINIDTENGDQRKGDSGPQEE